jgi:hypothetical protein
MTIVIHKPDGSTETHEASNINNNRLDGTINITISPSGSQMHLSREQYTYIEVFDGDIAVYTYTSPDAMIIVYDTVRDLYTYNDIVLYNWQEFITAAMLESYTIILKPGSPS